jgi:hypothetical protein
MAELWAEHEFGRAKLGDQRRTQRLIHLAEQRAQQPTASIPQNTGSLAECLAAYRFFDNQHITAEPILASHVLATCERLKGERVVLAVQDTTELDYTPHPATVGLGYLEDQSHHGLYVHTTLMVTPRRVPLGILQQQVWARCEEDFGKRDERKDRPIEEKESYKWLVSLNAVADIQPSLAETLLVSVGDSESDVYDLFALARKRNQALLVRAAQDRRVAEEYGYEWAQVEHQPVAGQLLVEVKREADRPARQATVEVRFCVVTVQPPRYRAKEGLAEVPLWAVLVREVNPPPGEKPIEWLLLTNVAVTSFAEACERVEWYTVRWVVEMFHKVLKSGCRVEHRQFEDADNLRRYLALDSVVAWRVLWLTLLNRETPDVPCTVILESHEWKALYSYVHKTTQLPEQVPSLREAVGWIAQLGGFLGRKHDGQPGMMVVWRGLQRLNDITATWLIFNPPLNLSL